MGRSYHLSKELKPEQATEILQERCHIPDLKQAQFTKELDYLNVETKDQEYYHVMSRAVNIFSQKADGCNLSFSKFV